MPDTLFTIDGRRFVTTKFPGLHVCANGFLDAEEGIALTDQQTLELLLERSTRRDA